MAMKKKLKLAKVLLLALLVFSPIFFSPLLASAEQGEHTTTPINTAAQNSPCSPLVSNNSFLTLPTWYKYIKTGKYDVNGKCSIPDLKLTSTKGEFSGGGILLVLLAVVDILLNLAGLIALGFIVYGGIRFVTSQGSSDGTKQARETVINAIIGLAIATVAIATVTFIGNRLG